MSIDFTNIGKNLVEQASKRNIKLRLLGANAFQIHCHKNLHILQSMGREITDIDLIGYGKQTTETKNLFIDLGYLFKWGVLTDRMIFNDVAGKYVVDVFFDRLEMCHRIDLKGRLEIDSPTISVSDLFLEKIQIVKINEKDIKDLMILLLEHDIGKGDKETINHDYISNLLSKDWGFYHTARTNLDLLKRMLQKYDILSKDDQLMIETRINKLVEAIDNHPKSLAWNLRAKVGTKKKWYQDVEDVLR